MFSHQSQIIIIIIIAHGTLTNSLHMKENWPINSFNFSDLILKDADWTNLQEAMVINIF